MENQRGWRLAYAYSEYVAACREAGERAYAYSTFCVGLREWRRASAAEGLPEWYPGENVRTYWSRGSATVAGERFEFAAFVAVMEFSDATFVCRADGTGTKSWMRCCEAAFRWLGGVPYVTDCTQSKASATAQSTLEAFARHYRTVLYGARPKTDKSAGRASKPVDAKRSSFVARCVLSDAAAIDFADLGELDGFIAQKVRAYNSVAPAGGRARISLLRERELPQMLSLPDEGADMATWSSRAVRGDYHFTVGGVRYSVPWRHSNRRVRVCWTESEVRAYLDGEMIARHERMTEPRGRCTVTDPSHRPPGHRWFANRMDDRFLALAKEHGGSTVRVMKRVLAACKRSEGGFAPCKELLDLAGEPSPVTLEEACASALAAGGEVGVEQVKAAMGGGGPWA